MPKLLGACLHTKNKDELIELCKSKQLNGYETEIIIRIYWDKQSINFIADTLDFSKYGKAREYYSSRTINNYHKDAFLKLLR